MWVNIPSPTTFFTKYCRLQASSFFALCFWSHSARVHAEEAKLRSYHWSLGCLRQAFAKPNSISLLVYMQVSFCVSWQHESGTPVWTVQNAVSYVSCQSGRGSSLVASGFKCHCFMFAALLRTIPRWFLLLACEWDGGRAICQVSLFPACLWKQSSLFILNQNWWHQV